MKNVESKLVAIINIREFCSKYLSGEICLEDFYSRISNELGNEFDMVEETVSDLHPLLQTEVLFYSRITGGEFGEYENILPKNKNWEYGKSKEKYGWINVVKYKEMFQNEYSKINLIKINT